MIVFAFKYLNVKKNFKYLKFFYYSHIITLAVVLPFSFTTFNVVFFNLTLIIAITVTFLVLITIFLQFIRKISFPIYFFAGALILGISIIVLVLNQLNIIGYSIFFEYSFAYAIAIEGMFFTLGIFDHIQRLKLMNRHYFKIAVKDQLTGLYNRYYLDVNIDKYFNQGRRYHEPLSMLLIDVDHFKKVNDTYGHDVGDQVLIELSRLLKENIRESDLLIRWGGEEFLVVLPKTDSLGCSALGEKIRKTVESYDFQKIQNLTISIGGGKWLPFEKKDELFKKVDDALYEAKKNGRNKYVMNLSYYASMKTLEQELQWSKAYDCNHQVIDEQHKTIFKIFKNLVGSVKSDENFERHLDKMFKYSIKHIKTEESILEKKSYDQLIEHKKVHEELLSILKNSIKKYKNSIITKEQLIYELIQDIIVGHLISYDYKYFHLFDQER
jgi:diguanylate cyclase (GGDEF)-like protein/hemerythrin-like metal-binding protein